MTRHPESPSHELIDTDTTSRSTESQSNTRQARGISGRVFYWWSLTVAAMLLLLFGPPAISVAFFAKRREWVYPWALWGGRMWLRLSGMEIRVRGVENLDPKQNYVFISNHRSYLDTATLFCYLKRRIGLLSKKEVLKVPILGYGMGYVNVMAIDRSNRERAIETIQAATARIHSGVSFGVFAEGTRALPGQLLPFKKGAFYMAIEAGVPIVPVAIKNTDMLMGKGTGVARPGTIEMAILEPISTKGLSTDEDVDRLVERVHRLVADELGCRG